MNEHLTFDPTSDEPVDLSTVFSVIRSLRRRNHDFNVKVVTTDDIYSTLGLDEVEYAPEVEEALRERIRNSWEMSHWTDMFDDDWMFFDNIDGIDETLARYELVRDQ
jgi:hypothetical protein